MVLRRMLSPLPETSGKKLNPILLHFSDIKYMYFNIHVSYIIKLKSLKKQELYWVFYTG